NVGQGQWTTYVHPLYCIHIDVGGEFYPMVDSLCQTKINYVEISHWDLDHYRYLSKLKRKMRISKEKPPGLRVLFSSKMFKDKNSNSFVHSLHNVLFTGDSTAKAEKLWAHLISDSSRIFLVPHHGSRTSSSKYLLNHLKMVKM